MSLRKSPDNSWAVVRITRLATTDERQIRDCIRHVARHLQWTLHVALLCEPIHTSSWSCYTDASWSPEGDYSHQAIVLYCGANLVAWQTQRQSLVAISNQKSSFTNNLPISKSFVWRVAIVSFWNAKNALRLQWQADWCPEGYVLGILTSTHLRGERERAANLQNLRERRKKRKQSWNSVENLTVPWKCWELRGKCVGIGSKFVIEPKSIFLIFWLHFIFFGPLWSVSVEFGPTLGILVNFGCFGPSRQFYAVLGVRRCPCTLRRYARTEGVCQRQAAYFDACPQFWEVLGFWTAFCLICPDVVFWARFVLAKYFKYPWKPHISRKHPWKSQEFQGKHGTIQRNILSTSLKIPWISTKFVHHAVWFLANSLKHHKFPGKIGIAQSKYWNFLGNLSNIHENPTSGHAWAGWDVPCQAQPNRILNHPDA